MEPWKGGMLLLFLVATAFPLVSAQDFNLTATIPASSRNKTMFDVTAQRNQNSFLASRSKDDSCNCTSLFQCDLGLANSEEDGANVEVIDIRNQLGSKFPCKHYLDICCNHYQHQSPPYDETRSPQLKNIQQCGRRNVNGVGFRIVGGLEGEAQMGEFPWMVAITEINLPKDRVEYVCGGSLIHPRVVLTVAHCISKKASENLSVRVGEWDTHTEREDPYIHHDRDVDQIIIHEDYQVQKVLKNDIALLVLSRDVPLARHIGPICLSEDFVLRKGQRCFASGWGKNLFGKEGSYQNILKKVDLPFVPSDECQTIFRGTRLGPNFRLHESFICLGGERGRDTCKGDGGSPVVCQMPGSDRYVQVGIVSWGIRCGDPIIPGVYVNVPLFVPWIERKLRSLNLDNNSFKM